MTSEVRNNCVARLQRSYIGVSRCSSATCRRKTVEFHKPKAVCRIGSGAGGDVAVNFDLPCKRSRENASPSDEEQYKKHQPGFAAATRWQTPIVNSQLPDTRSYERRRKARL